MLHSRIPNEVRRAIYRREGYACALCGDPRHLHIHHAIPRSEGGGNTPRNLVALCRYCHSMAHGTNLLESEIHLDAEECREYAEEVSLNAVIYLADMYAAVFPECPGNWDPMDNYDYDNPEFVHLAKTEIEVCIKRAGRWR